VVETLAKQVEAAHAEAVVEANEPEPDGSRLRPDLLAALIHGGPWAERYVEVSVVNPTTKSSLQQASSGSGSLSAASARAAAKVAKYRQLMVARHCTLVPFILESFGAVHDAAIELVDILAAHHVRAGGLLSEEEFVKDTFNYLSVCLQRSNGRAILRYVQRVQVLLRRTVAASA
jgi:hypothetical protein